MKFSNLVLVPITTDQKAMAKYLQNDFCKNVFQGNLKYYEITGFNLPWVGYFALAQNKVVGVGGFKGAPQNNTVEIAYTTLPENEGKGVATQICQGLVQIALEKTPLIRITARTLMEENASTSILKKNNFKFVGTVQDPEDGPVWEWELIK